ncbi:hypothetical protein B4U84_24330 [Westiellopsis prolifica IICB1]|nr:hypothetical protein B4U84_24330 [Westiellopsis prolifica IICB1]
MNEQDNKTSVQQNLTISIPDSMLQREEQKVLPQELPAYRGINLAYTAGSITFGTAIVTHAGIEYCKATDGCGVPQYAIPNASGGIALLAVGWVWCVKNKVPMLGSSYTPGIFSFALSLGLILGL